MKNYCKHHQADLMELCDMNWAEPGRPPLHDLAAGEPAAGDDRYPGTFFRVPGVPVPGKTGWSIAK